MRYFITMFVKPAHVALCAFSNRNDVSSIYSCLIISRYKGAAKYSHRYIEEAYETRNSFKDAYLLFFNLLAIIKV